MIATAASPEGAGDRSLVHRARIAVFAMILLLAQTAGAQPTELPGSESGVRGTVLMLVVPGLQASDLTRPELKCLDRVASMGAVGWMNSRTGISRACRGDPVASGFLSLGAGTRACSPYSSWPRHADTMLGAMWFHDIDGLRRTNRTLLHRVEIGELGRICRKAGLSLHVVGDEGGDMPTCGGMLLACDPRGSVDSVNPAITTDPTAPYGRRAEIAAYGRPANRSLTVWVFGDLLRAESYANVCTPAQAEHHRNAALMRLATLLNERWMPFASEAAAGGNQAWLLSPAPSMQAHALDRLTPVALLGRGISSGLIISDSTRRPGLISMADVAATIARLVAVRPNASVVGRPAHSSRTRPCTTLVWRRLHDDMLTTSIAQRTLGPLPAVRLAILLAFCILAIAGLRLADFAARRSLALPATDKPIYESIGVGVASATLMQFWSGALPALSLVQATLVLVTAMSAGAALGWAFPRAARALVYGLCAGILAGYAVGLTACPAILSDGRLAYSVMDGARYYGIGNEMAGALLAACAVLSGPLMMSGRAWLGAGLFAVLAMTLAWPSGGANLGASVAAVFGVALAAVVAFGSAEPRPPLRALAIVLSAAALMVGLIAAVSIVDTGSGASHIGRALGSSGLIVSVAVRKLALNAHLLVSSPWTLCLIVGSALALWMHSVQPLPVRPGIRMLLTVATGLLIANDSGVVAAGMAVSVGVPLLLGVQDRRPETGQAKRVADDAD